MSAEAAVHSPPLALDPVALHADKLRSMVADIWSNHPDKGGCKKLPWRKVAEWVAAHQEISGGYDFAEDAYRKWHGGKDVTEPMLATVQAFVVAHVQHTSRVFAAPRSHAAGAAINILCPFLQLSSGLKLSAGTCWGGNSPHSLRHTPRTSRNGRSGHILKYPPRLMAAMGITSLSRGSSPGSCAELEPGAACYGYSSSRFSVCSPVRFGRSRRV